MICNNCRTEFTGKFCPTCGTAAQVGPAPVQVAPQTDGTACIYKCSDCSARVVHEHNGLDRLDVSHRMSARTRTRHHGARMNDESAKNFAKANLLIMLIVLIISLIAVGAMLLLGIGLGAASSN